MAQRSVTRRYADLGEFLQEHRTSLRVGAVLIRASEISGELAAEFRLDFLLPIVGRVGPVSAQVVARLPDGSVAARLPELPAQVTRAFDTVLAAVEEVRAWLLASGELVEPGAVGAAPAASEGAPSPGEADQDDEDEEDDEAIGDEDTSGLLARADGDEDDEDLLDEPTRGVSVAAVEPEPEEPEPEEPEPEEPEPEEPEPEEPPLASALPSPWPSRERRGIGVPSVSGVPATLKGDLKDRSLRDALVELAVTHATGVLRIELPGEVVRTGFWRAGGPVAWRSEPSVPGEALGELLLRAGQITEDQHHAALASMGETGLRYGETLVEQGVFPTEQLGALLTRQAEYVLMQVMQPQRGDWSFFPLEDLGEEFPAPPVPVLSLLFRAYCGHARKMLPKNLKYGMRTLLPDLVFLRRDAIDPLRQVRFSREEASLLDHVVRKPRTLEDLLEHGPQPFEVAAPALWALNELSLLEFKKPESEARVMERVAERLAAKHAQTERGTPFDVLELHWICLGQEVERSHRRLVVEYAKEAYGALPAEQERVRAAIASRIEAAAQALSDPERRRSARSSVIREEDITASAAMLARRGANAVSAGDRARALACFSKALELRPGTPEYINGLSRATEL